ncbi:histone-lysine N-methyltransferase SETD1B-like isoform X2 [Littorina saxatilis]
MTQVCGQCGKKEAGLKRCTGCLMIRYCSRDCQKLHWPRHRVICAKSPASAASQAMTSQQKRSLPNDKPGASKSNGGATRAKKGDAAVDAKPPSGSSGDGLGAQREPKTSDETQRKKARRDNPLSETSSSHSSTNGFAASPPGDARGHFKADDMVASRSHEGTQERRDRNENYRGDQSTSKAPAESLSSRPYFDEEVGEYDEAVSTSEMQLQSGSEDDAFESSEDENQGAQRPSEEPAAETTADDHSGFNRSNNVREKQAEGDGYEAEMDYQESTEGFPGEERSTSQQARGESPPGGTLVEEYEATTVEYRGTPTATGRQKEKTIPGREKAGSEGRGNTQRGEGLGCGEEAMEAEEIKINVEYAQYMNPAGETLAPTAPGPAALGDEVPVPCKTCKTKTSPCNKCSRCLDVTYCSRKCQRLDWVVHKTSCIAIDILTTTGFRTLEDREFEGKEAERLSDNELTTMTPESPYTVPHVTWPEARSRASRMFPWHRVIDKFDDLERDLVGMPFAPFLPWLGTEGVVAIARLTTPYYHPFRHAWSIHDITGKDMYVIFYHEEFPFPHFRYNQLKKNNFICLQNALVHTFADGTVGFRIDHPSVVRILEPSF